MADGLEINGGYGKMVEEGNEINGIRTEREGKKRKNENETEK